MRLRLSEDPARRVAREVLLRPGVSDARTEREQPLDAMAVLLLVRLRDLLRHRGRRLHVAFEDDDVVTALEVDDHARIARDVPPFRRLAIRAEPDRAVEPHSPHRD